LKSPHTSITWWVLLFLIALLGAALIWCYPAALPFLARVSVRIKPDAGGRFVGIVLLSVVIGHLCIYFAMRGIHKLFDIVKGQAIDLWPQALVGILEAVLYIIALVMARHDFIAFWVAIKTAGGWVAWSGSHEKTPLADEATLNKARRRFYAFLIGNGFAMMAALTTFGLLKLFALKF
jgi:hypothetical protein